MDRISKQQRSWNMSRIKSSDTAPERVVRSLLHRLGFRFRLNSSLTGKPDLVLPKYNTVVFVHGCFWHRHKNCKLCYSPKTNIEFWNQKFQRNLDRDRLVQRTLKCDGWKVLIIWECELSNPKQLTEKLKSIGQRTTEL